MTVGLAHAEAFGRRPRDRKEGLRLRAWAGKHATSWRRWVCKRRRPRRGKARPAATWQVRLRRRPRRGKVQWASSEATRGAEEAKEEGLLGLGIIQHRPIRRGSCHKRRPEVPSRGKKASSKYPGIYLNCQRAAM